MSSVLFISHRSSCVQKVAGITDERGLLLQDIYYIFYGSQWVTLWCCSTHNTAQTTLCFFLLDISTLQYYALIMHLLCAYYALIRHLLCTYHALILHLLRQYLDPFQGYAKFWFFNFFYITCLLDNLFLQKTIVQNSTF